jgi:hypothetical protein
VEEVVLVVCCCWPLSGILLPVLIGVFQFEQLANIKFFCKPGKMAAVEVFGSLSAVCGGEAFINLLCATGATALQSSIKEH